MLVIGAGIHKLLITIANRKDLDKTAPVEAVWSGSALFVWAFLAGNEYSNLEHLPHATTLFFVVQAILLCFKQFYSVSSDFTLV